MVWFSSSDYAEKLSTSGLNEVLRTFLESFPCSVRQVLQGNIKAALRLAHSDGISYAGDSRAVVSRSGAPYGSGLYWLVTDVGPAPAERPRSKEQGVCGMID